MTEFRESRLPGIIGKPLELVHRALGRLLYGKERREVYPYMRYEVQPRANRWGGIDYPYVEVANVVSRDFERRRVDIPGGRIEWITQRRSK